MNKKHILFFIGIIWGVCFFKLPISYCQVPIDSIGLKDLNEAQKLGEVEKYEASNDKALSAIDIFYKNKNWESWADSYIQLYSNARAVDSPEKLTSALSQFKIAERNIKENKEVSDRAIAVILGHTALLQQNLGRYWEAITYYQKAFPYAEKTKDDTYLCILYASVGTAYWMIGDDKKSINYNEKALRIANELGEIKFIIYITNGLANAWRTVDIQKAIPLYQQSLQLYPIKSETHMLLSKAYIESEGDPQLAMNAAQNGWKYADNDFEKADALHQIGRVYHYKKDFVRALRNYNNALTFAKKSYGKSHPEYIKIFYFIGNTHLENGKLDQALLSYNKVLDNLLPLFSPTSADQLPLKGDFTNTSLWIGEALIGKSKTYQERYLKSKKKEDLEKALTATELGIYYFQKIRLRYSEDDSKYLLNDNYYTVVGNAMDYAFQLNEIDSDNNYLENAFQLCAQSKAIVLAENLYRKELKQLSGVPDSILNKEKKLYRQIAFWEKKLSEETENLNQKKDSLFSAKRTLDNFEAKMETSFPELAKAKFENNLSKKISSIQKEISDNTLLIEYFLSKKTIYTFFITQDSFWTYTQNRSPDFDKNIQSFIRTISDWKFTEDSSAYASNLFLETGHWIYKNLLLENLPPGEYKNLIIIPDKSLSLIPFEVLLTESYEGTWIDREVPFLLKDYSISYRFSSIFSPNNSVRTLNNWGGFGVEFNEEEELDYLASNYNELALRNNGRLPYADEEVIKIGKSFGGDVWLNQDATRENFLKNAEEFDILHLATHAVVDKNDPLRSKIIFANSIVDNNPAVYAHEIYSLQLKAGLTVLSACNSGTGSYKKGEGIMSLARAFTYAGCPSVVMSLWNVSDQATSTLMTKFYKNLKLGFTKDEALRQAKLAYLKAASSEYTKPIYWGSFVAVGDMSSMKINSSSNYSIWKKSLLGFLVFLLVFVFIRRRFS